MSDAERIMLEAEAAAAEAKARVLRERLGTPATEPAPVEKPKRVRAPTKPRMPTPEELGEAPDNVTRLEDRATLTAALRKGHLAP
jgi:hypothetical protein